MPDRIILENLQFFGYHGCLAEENSLGQRFAVSLCIGSDLLAAGLSDDLTQSINYAEVCAVVKAIMEGPPSRLIETLAERIAGAVLDMGALEVEVTVKKIHPPIPVHMDFAAVQIARRRSSCP